MSEVYSFKSKLISLCDYSDFDITGFLPEFIVDEEKLAKDISRTKKSMASTVEGKVVCQDDMVQLCLKSELAKYNKDKVMVTVGKGIFSEELEDSLIGKELGETFTIHVEENDVTVTIQKITHYQLPELTEDKLREIRRECVNRQIARLLDQEDNKDMASAMLCKYIADNSQFQLDSSEVEYVKEHFGNYEDGQEIDEELKGFFEAIALSTFKNALAGYQLSKDDNTLLTVEDYNKHIESLQGFYQELAIEEIKEQNPIFEYMETKYADRFICTIDDQLTVSFQNALNKE